MSPDFLAAQIASTEPLEFIRLWVPGDEPNTYRWVTEAIHESDGLGFSIVVPSEVAEQREEGLTRIGFEGGSRTMPQASAAEVAEVVRDVLGIVAADARKVSLTHGPREELVRRRRLDAVVDEANRILRSKAAGGEWVNDRRIPIQFRSGYVQLTLWPKYSDRDTVLLEIWAFVASALPDRPEVDELIAQCNEGFTYGRLLRQDRRLWYRETIHAAPLTDGALDHSVVVAANTARTYGPRFAEFGAVDGTAPEPTPSGLPERPPDAAISRSIGGYL